MTKTLTQITLELFRMTLYAILFTKSLRTNMLNEYKYNNKTKILL